MTTTSLHRGQDEALSAIKRMARSLGVHGVDVLSEHQSSGLFDRRTTSIRNADAFMEVAGRLNANASGEAPEGEVLAAIAAAVLLAGRDLSDQEALGVSKALAALSDGRPMALLMAGLIAAGRDDLALWDIAQSLGDVTTAVAAVAFMRDAKRLAHALRAAVVRLEQSGDTPYAIVAQRVMQVCVWNDIDPRFTLNAYELTREHLGRTLAAQMIRTLGLAAAQERRIAHWGVVAARHPEEAIAGCALTLNAHGMVDNARRMIESAGFTVEQFDRLISLAVHANTPVTTRDVLAGMREGQALAESIAPVAGDILSMP